MVNTKPVLLALLLAVTLPLTGCTALTDDGDTDDPDVDEPAVDGEQLRTATLETMNSVETVRITQNLTMDLGGQPVTAESEGVMDIGAEKARVTTTTSSTAGSAFEQTQYLVGDTTYFESEALGGWVKQNLSAFSTWSNNQFAQQERLLGNASLEVTGQQTVDGNEVYVTELNADSETLNALFSEQAGNVSSQLASDVSFKDMSVTQHIDVETNRVHYAKIAYSFTARGQEITFSLEQRFSEFNEPVDIELPEEAKSASPIEDAYGGGYSGTSA